MAKKKAKDFRTFEQWHQADIGLLLNVRPVNKLSIMNEWLNVEPYILEKWEVIVQNIRDDLYFKHQSWNETELTSLFIGPFLSTLEWKSEYYNLFHQRPLAAKVGNYDVHGTVDGMVAGGYYEPEKPYFFLQEYKRTRMGDSDPLGQLLIAMLAARVLNEDENMTMYGCYVYGKHWTFVLLEGNTYAQSQSYDLTDETEIQIVWAILKKTKDYIEKRVLSEMKKEN